MEPGWNSETRMLFLFFTSSSSVVVLRSSLAYVKCNTITRINHCSFFFKLWCVDIGATLPEQDFWWKSFPFWFFKMLIPYLIKVKSLSRVRLFTTPWTAAHQAPLFMDSSGKNTGVGCHFLLQGIFPTQGSNPSLPHCRQTLYRLSHQGSPILLKEIQINMWRTDSLEETLILGKIEARRKSGW